MGFRSFLFCDLVNHPLRFGVFLKDPPPGCMGLERIFTLLEQEKVRGLRFWVRDGKLRLCLEHTLEQK